jgi:hypothetical protein
LPVSPSCSVLSLRVLSLRLTVSEGASAREQWWRLTLMSVRSSRCVASVQRSSRRAAVRADLRACREC